MVLSDDILSRKTSNIIEICFFFFSLFSKNNTRDICPSRSFSQRNHAKTKIYSLFFFSIIFFGIRLRK